MLALHAPTQEVGNKNKNIHYCWDDDLDRSLCGIDLVGRPLTNDEVTCVKCLEIGELLDHFDNTGDTMIVEEILDTYRK